MNAYTRWEYKEVDANFADLNSLGGEGWELCGINGQFPNCVYIFKRPKINIVEKATGGNAGKYESKLVATLNPAPLKIGDWVIHKDGFWEKAYKILEIKNNKVYIWVNGALFNHPYPINILAVCDDFEKYPKHERKPVKKANPNNPNNIRKGDWVSISKDTSGPYAYGAYKVHSVKDGNLTILYQGKPDFSWKSHLKTVHKVTKEEMEFYRKIF